MGEELFLLSGQINGSAHWDILQRAPRQTLEGHQVRRPELAGDQSEVN